jgi:hypothetical protein
MQDQIQLQEPGVETYEGRDLALETVFTITASNGKPLQE